MGEYFHILCHTCKKQHAPDFLKLREIFLNQRIAAEVGRFACEHAGHLLELRGDENTKHPDIDGEAYDTYEHTTEREIRNLREGIEE